MKLSPTMVSSDEDFNLFLEEFLNLLNKYHYSPHNKMRLTKLGPDLGVVGFSADGKFVWTLIREIQSGELYHTNYETSEV